MDDVDGADEVRRHHLVPPGEGHVGERSDVVDARARDHRGTPRPALPDLGTEGIHARGVGDVLVEEREFGVARDLRGHRVAVDDDDGISPIEQTLRSRQADAAGTAGDDVGSRAHASLPARTWEVGLPWTAQSEVRMWSGRVIGSGCSARVASRSAMIAFGSMSPS